MAKILVIDDEKVVRMAIMYKLKKEGHEVIEAEDGDEGIAKYRENPADLIITDIIMPNKEGFETIKDLNDEFPDAKIVAMSGGGASNSKNYLETAKKFNVVDVFEKSFEWEEMIRIVRKIFPK
ncbi:MAG: response regulator [bacterium]